ncbi:MAG: TatD family hydrolase [Chromatiales bacterium]
MIDCHSHLGSTEFDADRGQVIVRAREAGVERILVVGEDAADDRRTLEVCERHPAALAPCLGLHPDRFADDREPPSEADIAAVEALAREHRAALACIGEVGLDYWCTREDGRRADQRACLERMAALARELDLALNVHSRSAGRYTIDLLAACGTQRVLMHAFDGKASHAVRAVDTHGYVFSVPPSVVRSAQKQKLVRRLPLDALVLESDSPVLGPEAGVRNEPANLTHSVRLIAELHGVSEDRVREATTANARRLLGEAAIGP